MINAAILTTINAVAQRYQATYSVPSQAVILALLVKYHGVVLSRRTLCYRLRTLERRGALSRTRRHVRLPSGRLLFRSTLYVIRDAGRNLMKSVANMAKRFFFGSRVQLVAQYLKRNYICNKEMMKSIQKTALPERITGPLQATLERMTLRFSQV